LKGSCEKWSGRKVFFPVRMGGGGGGEGRGWEKERKLPTFKKFKKKSMLLQEVCAKVACETSRGSCLGEGCTSGRKKGQSRDGKSLLGRKRPRGRSEKRAGRKWPQNVLPKKLHEHFFQKGENQIEIRGGKAFSGRQEKRVT